MTLFSWTWHKLLISHVSFFSLRCFTKFKLFGPKVCKNSGYQLSVLSSSNNHNPTKNECYHFIFLAMAFPDRLGCQGRILTIKSSCLQSIIILTRYECYNFVFLAMAYVSGIWVFTWSVGCMIVCWTVNQKSEVRVMAKTSVNGCQSNQNTLMNQSTYNEDMHASHCTFSSFDSLMYF